METNHQSFSRIGRVFHRYGWRTPIVTYHLCLQKLLLVRNFMAVTRLRLSTKGEKGKSILIGREVDVTPGSLLALGDEVNIGNRCIFEIGVDSGGVTIGASTWISHDFHLQGRGGVSIGANVLIGEFVSVRDTSHSYIDAHVPIRAQTDVTGSLTIEDDVWIGRGCLIQSKLPGIVIGKGAIIGANAVVTKSIPSMEIWGGVPAKFLKSRRNINT
jgi:acetyltransferase-like isoleucine patch superfamily enzyme